MKTILLSALVGVILISGCGDIAKIWQPPKECPITLEEDFYIHRELLDVEVEDMAIEWDNNPNTYTIIEGDSDGDYMTVTVFEDGCESHIFYYYPVD